MTDHPETEIQFIRRIIAMLLSLAGIAERAAKRAYPVRAFLLWILRRAETAAQDYVGVEDLWAGAVHGSGPQDALDLADSLRELAAFLEDDLRRETVFQRWWDGNGHHGRLADDSLIPPDRLDSIETDMTLFVSLRRLLRRIAGACSPPSPAGRAPRFDSS